MGNVVSRIMPPSPRKKQNKTKHDTILILGTCAWYVKWQRDSIDAIKLEIWDVIIRDLLIYL